MMRREIFQRAMIVMGCVGLLCAGSAGAEEAEVMIARYGKVLVKSQTPDARVFVDDIYKGRTGNVIESITAGPHTISCRTETQTISGVFEIRKNELLQLEARFDENKFVVVDAQEKAKKAEAEKKLEAEKKVEAEKKIEAAKKIEAEKKLKAVAAPLKPKKPVHEPQQEEERKSPAEERRSLHLNMIKVFFDDIDSKDVRITHKINPKVITNFADKKDHAGTYYRTKKGVLLCDVGPCEQQWSSSFVYTDDLGKTDTISLTWKQTIFNGITPAGTSKRELLACLNGVCEHLEDASVAAKPQAATVGRYHLAWTRSSLVIRRSDIMQEITSTGGLPEAY